jgi:pimeloyl-ACP methyl ester carboxylesterase
MRRMTHEVATLGALPAAVLGPPDAPPLVLLPGLSPEHAVGRGLGGRLDLTLAHAFAGRFRVTWVARRRGLADDPAPATMASLAAELADALQAADDALGAPVDVLGISTGGSLALQLAADRPEVVRRLVVVSAAARLGARAQAEQRALAECVRAGDRRGAFAQLAADLATGAPRPLAMVARPPLALAGRLLGPLSWPDAGDLRDLAAVIDAEDGFDLTGRLGDVRAPTLVVAGGRDPYSGRDAFEALARGVRDGRLARFARRGHVTVASDPRFVPTVERFLSAPAGD